MNPRNWPDSVQIMVAVVILMAIRFVCIAIGVGAFYLAQPRVGTVPAVVLSVIVAFLLITITGTWQWQMEE